MADAALDQLLKTNAGLASDFFSRGQAAEKGINSVSKINVPLPKVPKLAQLPKPPQTPKEDALAGFTGLAPLLSVLGGFLTRRPLVASLNALAASNNAFHAGEQEGYIRNLQAFRDNLDVIAAQNRQDLESYNAALNNAQLTQAQKVAEIQTLASERRDDFMMAQDNLKSMATAIAAKENIASRMEAARLAADSRIKAANIYAHSREQVQKQRNDAKAAKTKEAVGVYDNIDNSLDRLMKDVQANPAIIGLTGRAAKFGVKLSDLSQKLGGPNLAAAFAGLGITGLSDEQMRDLAKQATDFETRIRTLQAELARPILQAKYFSGPIALRLDQLVSGLGTLDSPTTVVANFKALKDVVDQQRVLTEQRSALPGDYTDPDTGETWKRIGSDPNDPNSWERQ